MKTCTCGLLVAGMALFSLHLCGQSADGQGDKVTQGPQSEDLKKSPVARGSVTGRVILADLRGPARGARVMLMAAGHEKGKPLIFSAEQMALTGLDGSFLIEHVAPGEYFVLAFAAGYLSPLDGVRVEMDGSEANDLSTEKTLRETVAPVRVAGAERVTTDLELRRGAVFAGRVTYADGLPASQLAILVEPANQQAPQSTQATVDAGAVFRALLLAQRNTTDDEGRFRIAGLPPGSYRVAVPQASNSVNVTDQLFQNLGADGQPHELTFYAGDTLHPKAARTYKIAAGETIDGVDIVLPLGGLHKVSGALTSKDGQPVNYAQLTLVDTADPAISFQTMLDAAAGEFRFSNVPEGTYTLKVNSAGFVANPAPFEIAPEVIDHMENYRRSRAYADQTVSVIVQTTDRDGLELTLVETKLPVIPTIQPQPTPTP